MDIEIQRNIAVVAIVALVAGFIAYASGSIFAQSDIQSIETKNDNISTASLQQNQPKPQTDQDKEKEAAAAAIEAEKTMAPFPRPMNQYITLIGISAVGRSIFYYYNTQGLNWNVAQMNEQKATIISADCALKATRALLEDGIELHYYYSPQDSGQPVFFAVTNADCEK